MNVKKYIVAILCVVLVLSFAGCGKKAPTVTLQDIVEETKGQISSIQNMLGDTMDIEISARGASTLVYTFTFLTDVGDTSLIGSMLAEAIERENEVYENLLQVLKNAGIPSPAVVVEYLDHEGNEIFSKKYD